MSGPRPAKSDVGVLIVDSDPAQRRALKAILGRERRFRVSTHANAESAQESLACGQAGVIIADMNTMGDRQNLASPSPVPLIAMSADASLNVAVTAMQQGAVDFLAKPVGARALMEKVQAAMAAGADSQASKYITPAAAVGEGVADFHGFIGRSAAINRVYDQIRRIARSTAPVFITGESGAGKEVCAEAIHGESLQRDAPFVAINCGAIPSELMESEIFGHVRGAFTGAVEARTGAAETADGGTLFLDEITELNPPLQAKLLRFLQSGEFRRVGDTRSRRADIRILCATNRDPREEIAAGRLRDDLYYRLHVLPVHLPPLRQRRDDIPLLAEAFLRRFSDEEGHHGARFDAAVVARLKAHDWPGNVRELANAVRRMAVLGGGGTLSVDLLATEMMDATVPAEPASGLPAAGRPQDIQPLWMQERAIIEAAIAACDGNITQAAAALAIDPSTIYRKRQVWRRHPGT